LNRLWLPELDAGTGDIAAAGLTVTPERAEVVAFTSPYIPKVSEVVVASRGRGGELESLDSLAGREVHVVRGSSYVESLRRLNGELEGKGLEPVKVSEMDPELGLHDILEMVHAGLVDLTVGDLHVHARQYFERALFQGVRHCQSTDINHVCVP